MERANSDDEARPSSALETKRFLGGRKGLGCVIGVTLCVNCFSLALPGIVMEVDDTAIF